jgi:hypothetical protein|tara:strand:- start:80 stop:589 length:510 start_codon:yes stop_codon:yes gene_type:complete
MDIKKIKTEFIISKVPNHRKHKTILLNLINKMPANSYYHISKTDWNLLKDTERKYLDYFYSNISHGVMGQQQKYFKAEKWEIINGWFQQYEKNSSHIYHNHPSANFTNIYFLELPDLKFKTSIKIGEKKYDYAVKEGQVITFPAHLLHCSKSNGNLRKTIISFNSNFIY